MTTVGSLPQGVPTPAFPWTSIADVGPLLIAAVGITLVSLTDTIATVDELRRPARRRGRPRPGDDRHGSRQHRRRVLPGLRRVDQQLAHRGGRAVRRQEPGDRPGRRRPRRAAPAVPQLAARRPAPDHAGRRGDLRRRLADGLRRPPPLLPSAQVGARSLARRHARCGALRRAVGDRHRRHPGDPAVLPAQLVAARCPCSGRVDGLAGWHSVDTYPDAVQLPGIVVYRWEAPLFFANAGRSSATRSAAWSRDRARLLGRPAVRGHHRHRRHGGRRCSSNWTTS